MAAGALSSDDQPEISVGSRSTPPSVPSSKAAVAPPKFTQAHDDLELNNMATNGEPPKQSLPIEDDIMQLARLGEVGAMQKLFDSKKFTAKYQDEEGITPLHVSSLAFPFAYISLLPSFPFLSFSFVFLFYFPIPAGRFNVLYHALTVLSSYSGPLSTINMPCASSFSTPVLT